MQSAASTELRLKEKWTELLGVEADDVAPDSNFFALGGNSMLVLSLHLFISMEFNIPVTLPELFDNAEFASMTALVASKGLKLA